MDHLGYDIHQPSVGSNSRNGHSSKTVYTDDGALEIDVPRDRDSSFKPPLIKLKKQQTRFTGMDDKILFLYAQGMTTREICTAFKERYDADVSASLISKVTNSVMEQGVEWQARPLDEALRELDQVEEKWRVKYPLISRSWRKNWDNLNTLFAYPPEIRNAIYTTNAIESLNSVIRKAIKRRKLFPHDEAAKKVVYLATREASKRWTMPIHNWRAALNHFMIVFEDRLSDTI